MELRKTLLRETSIKRRVLIEQRMIVSNQTQQRCVQLYEEEFKRKLKNWREWTIIEKSTKQSKTQNDKQKPIKLNTDILTEHNEKKFISENSEELKMYIDIPFNKVTIV